MTEAAQSPQEAGYHARPEYAVPLEEALRMVKIVPNYNCGASCPGGDHVHTVVMAGPVAAGAHWCLDTFRQHVQEWGIERSGQNAMSHGLGLVTWKQNGEYPADLMPANYDPKGFHAVYFDTI